jgi:hypothetical protein
MGANEQFTSTADIGHYIGGRRVAGTSGRNQPVTNPATGAVARRVALASAAEVDAAVAAAKAAQPAWGDTPPLRRARVMQTFLNLVEFGMNPQQAIEAPRWASQSFPASPFPHTMYPGAMTIEDRIPKSVLDALQAKGHRLRVVGGWSLGSNAAILIDPETGALSAGADPRSDAYALAW